MNKQYQLVLHHAISNVVMADVDLGSKEDIEQQANTLTKKKKKHIENFSMNTAEGKVFLSNKIIKECVVLVKEVDASDADIKLGEIEALYKVLDTHVDWRDLHPEDYNKACLEVFNLVREVLEE